ncbi:dienelactone hydrolase family protein [Azospirillum brasilense]|uniref:Dienelactone hydrolase family protein n=1 Tax=Azospirillum brasilense TaxID=192 RepID=A0A0P0EXB6_AZOBR|nr:MULTISPECIES: dienelactone hydrolase family protein [Azospirillum]ALJ35090.1 carboxymethylenebutenolidase [Azospirillum brasilense]MDW7553587.1 dienelactone hydrolase family protein [Azospirillum brasilense]MDW7594207.1 dienelactone hydrolase family protein [Azospirillum brasilense]MDW7629079.1 dienelactone hydrolase family protein [Azospirillum brasilense]MDX5953778.1 dienelactone hydrolase family protein [Azospirillum brasilense]
MTDISIPAGDGGSFSAYVAKPAGGGPAPGLVVIQEIFGVNQVMRDLCDGFAAQGWLAVCPDLFWRQEPGVQITDKTQEEWNRAFALMNGMDQDKAVDDLKATLAWLRQNPDCTGKAGSVGYCLGGRLAFMMAARSDSDANVSYYGVGLDGLVGEAASITKPLLMHIAEKDQFVPAEAREKVLAAVKGNPNVTAHVYPGVDHAFARAGGAHFDAEAAELANGRTAAFFKQHLG